MRGDGECRKGASLLTLKFTSVNHALLGRAFPFTLSWNLELVREGIPFDEIVRDYYPDLTVEDVQACVDYAVQLIKQKP